MASTYQAPRGTFDVLPAAVLISVGLLYPGVRTIFESFKNAAGTEYIGIDNYKTIFTTDIDRFNSDTRDIRFPYFSGRPAATLVEVSKLVDPRMLVEIEAIVCLD